MAGRSLGAYYPDEAAFDEHLRSAAYGWICERRPSGRSLLTIIEA